MMDDLQPVPSVDLTFAECSYKLTKVASFRRPSDEFGGFSNMPKAYPLRVYGLRIPSSEHLYQAMRFTGHPSLQQQVLEAGTPMFAKRVARSLETVTRGDWLDIRVSVMRWILRVKLAQHVVDFGQLLQASGNRPIVEFSRRDPFWGAVPIDVDDVDKVRGHNVLGKLLAELRDEMRLRSAEELAVVATPQIPALRVMGADVETLCFRRTHDVDSLVTARDLREQGLPPGPAFGFVVQVCLQKQLAGTLSHKSEALEFALALWVNHSDSFRTEGAHSDGDGGPCD